jgi:hypothetical protein
MCQVSGIWTLQHRAFPTMMKSRTFYAGRVDNMKRSLLSLALGALFVAVGCGGDPAPSAAPIEIIRPFAGEALINSTMQPLEWSGGDPNANVDIVFVSKEGTSTVLVSNVPNTGKAEFRVNLLDLDQRQGGTVEVVSQNNARVVQAAGGNVPVGVGSLAAFSWNGSAEDYWWLNVHNGNKKLVGTVGDMRSWAMNTVVNNHSQNRIYVVGLDATDTQKVYSLHAKTGALLADPPITGTSAYLVGLVYTSSGMLAGFAWDEVAMAEKMYSLDPVTGVATALGVVGDLQSWQTETTYSAQTNEVYVAGIAPDNTHKLYVMDAQTGALVRAVPLTSNGSPISDVLGFATNSLGHLIAYRWNGAAEQMLRIDTMTGIATELGVVGDLQSWSSTADVNVTNDRAHVIGINAANENKLYTLDTITGELLDEVLIAEYPTEAVLVH